MYDCYGVGSIYVILEKIGFYFESHFGSSHKNFSWYLYYKHKMTWSELCTKILQSYDIKICRAQSTYLYTHKKC